jgi:hypothetical protein
MLLYERQMKFHLVFVFSKRITTKIIFNNPVLLRGGSGVYLMEFCNTSFKLKT